MELKKVNLVYFSATHTTQKIAKAIAKGTALAVEDYDFTLFYKAGALPAFEEDELVVIGAPVYVGRVPKVIVPYLKTLKGNNTPCVILGVYGNRDYDDYLVELEDMMTGQGFIPIAAAAFLGEHSFSDKLAGGRPNASDLVLAENFGKDIIKKITNMPKAQALKHGAVPGNRPYQDPYAGSGKSTPFSPVVNDNCIECGACAKACPSGAINPQNVREIDATKCLKCRACAHVCPVEAIDFENPTFWEHTTYLEENYAAYKEPVIIL